MALENRLLRALRRPSSADGGSDVALDKGISSIGAGDSTVFAGVGGVEGLESSANRLVCIRILHRRQVEARITGCGLIRKVLEAGEIAIESNSSRGAKRARGCMANPRQC